MKVLLLGGYGQFGLPTAHQLARYDLIDGVVIAGRSLDKAQRAAAEVGPKAAALRLDADDPAALERALDGIDAAVSFMWDEGTYLEPNAAAAVRAGSHYLNLRSTTPSPELDAAARAAGVSVLVGVGSYPGLFGMLDRSVLAELDEVDGAVSGLLWALLQDVWSDLYRAYMPLPGGLDRGAHGGELRRTLGGPASDEERLLALRDSRAVEMWLSWLSHGEPTHIDIPAVRSGALVRVDPLEDGVDLPLDRPGGGATVPVMVSPPVGEVDGAPFAELALSGLSPRFHALIHGAAARLRAEEIDFDDAVAAVHGELAADLGAHLLDPEVFAALPGYAVSAYGRKGGRPARAFGWLPQAYYTDRNWLDLTAANVAISTARLLRGDLEAPGAHVMVEVDTLDEAFVAELVSRLPEVPEGVPTIGRAIEFLDGEGAER